MNRPSPNAETLLPPHTMVDHFRVVQRIGRGGMSDVYLARDTQLGRRVALKLIRSEDISDPLARESFLFEARVTAQFSHPHIVTIYAVGEYSGQPYLALEYVDGQSLGDRLQSGPLGAVEAARIGLAVSSALAEAHAHDILHRDLKPENVLLGKDGRIRVVDFGLARLLAHPARSVGAMPRDEISGATLLSSGVLSEGWLTGTPSYMAPEQWCGKEVTPATDVFALGMVLFEMLEGHLPFEETTLSAIRDAVCNDAVPPIQAPGVRFEMKDLVARCLAKRPEERPHVDEIINVLDEVISSGRSRVYGEESPFRGLFPFREEHAGLFFGRDEEVGAFVERLREEPLLAVVGPSGAGKSSFVQAGVLPRLKEQRPWLAIVLRPGPAPFEALAGALRRAEGNGYELTTGESISPMSPEIAASQATLAAELMNAPGRLGIRLLDLAERQGADVMLLVDQLEELATLGADQDTRQRFLEALSAAADDARGPVRVVVTLRDDFLGKVAEGAAARRVLSQVVVLRNLGPTALAEIASKPLWNAGYAYEDPDLPNVMAAAVQGETSSLPLLQFTLATLWKARDRERKVIPKSAYTAIGGVEGALAGQADMVMSTLSPEDLRSAREIFLRLVTPSRTRRAVARSELLSGLPASAGDVLDRLIRERAIVARKGRGEDRAKLELVHESLIRRWEPLAHWLDETREDHAFLAEATQAASAWEKHGRRAVELWRGDALRDGERLAARLSAVPDEVRIFLDASRAHARRFQRRRRLVMSFSFAFLVVVAVGLFFMKREAEHHRAAAEEQRKQAEIQRTLAEQQRAQALYAISQALTEKAKELNSKAFFTDSAVYAAASSLHNPANPSSPNHLPGFAEQMPGARDLLLEARSELYRAQLGRVVGRWRHFEAPSEFKKTALSANGSRLVAGLADGTLVAWDLSNGRRLLSTRMYSEPVAALAVAPDGMLAASSGRGSVVHVFRTDTGESVADLDGHMAEVSALEFGPDGTILVSGSKDGELRVWSVAARRELAVLRGHRTEVTCLAVSSSGQTLASGGRDGTLRTWALPLGTPKGECEAHANLISDVTFAHNDTTLLTSSYDTTVGAWRSDDLSLLRRFTFRAGKVLSVRALGTEPLMVTMNSKDELVVTDLFSGRDLQKVPQVDGAIELRLAAALSAGLIAFPIDLKTIEVWRQLGPSRIRVLGAHQDRVVHLAWSADGGLLSSASLDKTARIWDARSGQALQVLRSNSVFRRPMAFSPDGSRLVTLGEDKTVQLWDPVQGRLVATVAIADVTWGFGISQDSKTLAVNGGKGYLWLVDLATGQVTERPDIRFQPHQFAEFTSERSLLMGTMDNGLELWDLGSGVRRRLSLTGSCEVQSWLSHRRLVSCADWTLNGFVLFDPEQDKEVWRVPMPKTYDFVNSADERFSFWRDNNGFVVLDLQTRAQILSLTFPGALVTPSPDGRTIAFSSDDFVMTMPFEPDVLAALGDDAVKQLNEAEALAGRHLVGFALETLP